MFTVPLLTTLHKALAETFDSDFAKEEFRTVHIGVDFPIKREDYPAIWIDFTPTQSTKIAGIDHKETDIAENGLIARRHSRWRFWGQATFTVLTMSSFERYRLLDEVIRVLAFGKEQSATAQFRKVIEDNEFVAVNYDADEIDLSGFTAQQGTPWNSPDFIYEATATIELQGEYITDPATGQLAILERIDVFPYSDLEPDPKPQGDWV
jgi:hypothetical protein